MMRKTDYEAIARIINGARRQFIATFAEIHEDYGNRLCDDIARSIADYCEPKDLTFRRTLFLNQCGVVDRAAEAAEAALRG